MAIAVFCAWAPIGLAQKASYGLEFCEKGKYMIKHSFLGAAALPTAAVALALFPFSIPAYYFTLYDDDD